MKKIVFTAILGMITYSNFSQSTSFYKVGDTLYYANNRATYLKTNTFVIVKQTNVGENSNVYKVEKFLFDETKNKYFLDSNFFTNGLQLLKANGHFISYHKNGEKASEGETINGKKGNSLWTYYYENGKKRSEEKMSSGSFFSDETKNLIISFWDKEGEQTVTNGNGFVQYTDEKGSSIKGSYKEGVKNGFWTAFDGKTKIYEETYKKGKLSKGKSWNKKGEAFSYKEVNIPAYYKKRDRASVRKYVDKKFNSNRSLVSGDVYVTFWVTKEGLLTDVNIIRGINTDYNTEIKRILSEMKGWTPSSKRGQSYKSKYSLNLHFSE